MKPINANTLSGFTLTAIALYLLSFFPFIPAWAVFITWACFFHMDGGINKNQAFFATLRHIELGAFASWISALIVLNNPLSGALADQLWAPVLIAAVIARLPGCNARQHFSQRFAAAGFVVRKVFIPSLHFCVRNRAPGQAVPRAEIHFDQRGVNVMPPAPAPQPAADIGAALQRRCPNDAG